MNVIEYYNQFAPTYDLRLNSLEINSQLVREVKKLFDKHKIVCGTILDVGCGTGLLQTALGNGFIYTGIEIASEMANYAKKRGYKIILEDMRSALKKIPTNSFEHVLAISSLQWVPNASEIITEIIRIARTTVTLSIDKNILIQANMRKKVAASPTHDHSNIEILNPTEDYEYYAWTTPSANRRINARMIFINKSLAK